MKKTTVLCILDGFGHSEKVEYNAIHQASMVNFSNLLKNNPHCLIKTMGKHVGLPDMQMGNSEVGHMTIGSGRVLYHDLVRINKAIENCEFAENKKLKLTLDTLKSSNKTCHIIGLISDGGVHSHINHIIAFADIVKKHGVKLEVHAILDGRDTSPQSAIPYIQVLQEHSILISTISGRYYAMDRDQRYDRTQKFYDVLMSNHSSKFNDPIDFINQNYALSVFDEFIEPSAAASYAGIQEGDTILVMNFRADRIRQILNAIVLPDFKNFLVNNPSNITIIGIVSYGNRLDEYIDTILPMIDIKNTLGEVLSNSGCKQLRIAETEKYAHVTFFFNGGREEPYKKEKRLLIPSPKVKTYDQKPEMAAYEITAKLINAITSQEYDFICVNFANLDMVGHTGDMEATKAAAKVIDNCLGEILKYSEEIEMLITADHGNAEKMFDDKLQQAHTAHTTNDVPLVYIGNKKFDLANGSLADIAPTLLELMEIPKPKEMTGNSLWRERC